MTIYFDNNASTHVAPEAVEAMMPFLDGSYGNPSSAHSLGREAKSAVEEARASLAELLGAENADEVVFTSGGTEGNNWAIFGAVELTGKKNIITTRVEHDAVLKTCKRMAARGCELSLIGVAEDGTLDLGGLRDAINENTALVSVMLANNETGVIHPIAEIAEIVKERSEALFHVDAVSAAGKVPLDAAKTGVDLMTVSGHKFYAPKGIGAMYIRRGVALPPFITGAGQEHGRRAGTEAVHQIAALGAAAGLVSDLTRMEEVCELRDSLENGLLEAVPNTRVNGSRDAGRRLPNTSSISFENANGEMLMNLLDKEGICVSTGSACHSKGGGSAVLEAMNVPFSYAMGSLRLSLGRYNTAEEVDSALKIIPEVVRKVRAFAGK
ncbi:MAG: aminotransferase class V-fold PLP-dependent enzyme [Acidobacteriota bacterium]|nr:MAG: aminotransferase class V-fold PLP-dependent enzyme [Acidobacteriota bacterium]